MNKIICSEEGKREICNEPSIAVETYPIYYGCGIDGRDHDIPTSQALSNGIVLFYTPTNNFKLENASLSPTPSKGEDRQLPTRIPRSTAAGSRTTGISTQHKKQSSTSHELQKREEGSGDWSTRAGLPAAPEVIMSHGGSRGILAEAFVQVCSGIARRCPVLAFQKDRADTKDAEVTRTAGFISFWLMNDISGKAMGGRSRGARCAVQACTYFRALQNLGNHFHTHLFDKTQYADLSLPILLTSESFFSAVYSSNKNLILWSYPLVRNYDVRKQDLLALSSDTRVLFIKGTKDWVSRV